MNILTINVAMRSATSLPKSIRLQKNTGCPVWCDGCDCASDGLHISSESVEYVVLSTDEPVKLGPKEFPPELALYLDQHVEDADPRVVIDQLPDDRMKVRLLPTEALRIGRTLLRLAQLAANPKND